MTLIPIGLRGDISHGEFSIVQDGSQKSVVVFSPKSPRGLGKTQMCYKILVL